MFSVRDLPVWQLAHYLAHLNLRRHWLTAQNRSIAGFMYQSPRSYQTLLQPQSCSKSNSPEMKLSYKYGSSSLASLRFRSCSLSRSFPSPSPQLFFIRFQNCIKLGKSIALFYYLTEPFAITSNSRSHPACSLERNV